MEVKELQKTSNEIIESIDRKLNVNHDENKTIIHIVEELGEVARQINNKNIRNIEQNKESLEEELSDVLMLIMRLANLHNINIEQSINKNIDKLKQRHNL